MSLSPGTRLGAYEVTAKLGEGGMGEVYRARDTKLQRDVAIKVLPELFATDADRLARFTREAQTLASLNHPNIAAIYGIEDRALVMELVEGEDLSALIDRGHEEAESGSSRPRDTNARQARGGGAPREPRKAGLPFAEALPIAKQIAVALEAAHEAGIIHRDLKPANIKVRGDGTVKVLDFGLAKAMGTETAEGDGERGQANSPTLTARATQMGMILGTAAYMAPEQAKGRPVDRRADVWAFGCVLYEMLTGRRAFEGEDVTDTLAAVVRGDPDWTRLPGDLPPTLRVLLERCLVKDRTDRLHDMSVVRFLMSDTAKALSSASASGAAAVPSTPAAAPRRLAPMLIATAAVAILATFGLTRWLESSMSRTPGAPARLAVVLPDGHEVTDINLRPIALSDDGARIAYVGLLDGNSQIYVRAIGDAAPRALEGTEGGNSPFFSPDGQWIGFFTASKLRKIAVGGAALQTLADAPGHRGGSWGDDGYVYFAPTNIGTIWRVPETGGTATEVSKKDAVVGEISHRWPHRIRGTQTLLFAAWTGPGDDEAGIATQTIGETGHHVLVKGGDSPRYAAAPGLLFYTHVGELFAAPWQPAQTSLGAIPVAMSERTNDGGLNEGAGNYAMSDTGTLAYLAGGRARNSMRVVWIDRAGKVEIAPIPERNYENVVVAPDSTRAIVQIGEGTTGLWMYDFGRNTLTPVGGSGGSAVSSQAPLWTPDGTRVLYRGTRKGLRNLFWRQVDGSADEERLTTKPDVSQTPTSISADSQWLLFNENGPLEPGGGVGIWVMRLNGDRLPRRLFASPAGESDGQFSPDGKWIAYQAAVATRQEIYVTPFPGPGPKRQISTEGGTESLWSSDGRELFFQSGTRLMSVAVTPGTTFSASTPRLVHEGRFLKTVNGNTPWSVTKDGRRFLRIQQVEPERPVTHVSLVLNWFDDVTRRIADGGK